MSVGRGLFGRADRLVSLCAQLINVTFEAAKRNMLNGIGVGMTSLIANGTIEQKAAIAGLYVVHIYLFSYID